MRTNIIETSKKVGESVLLKGWVHFYRDKGKIIFLELRDVTGIVQCVVWHEDKDAFEIAKTLKAEDVVEIVGQVNQRPENQINKETETGGVEVSIKKIKVINKVQADFPFEISKDKFKEETKEELRLKYRYLDLRRPKMKKNIILRHKINRFFREYLYQENFYEIETPILTKGTPEGAREYIVPSRLHQGKFYVLPQAPQQFKQLLMVAGFERYFQLARCFRDEDQRGDRQPEFTQLDLEMSFVEREEVMDLMEKMLIALIKNICPEKKIQTIPFPRISYAEVMKKYKTDKPDLRNNKNDNNLLAFCWVIDFPFFEKTEEGKWTFTHNPFSAPKPEYLPLLMAKEKIGEILTSQYDIVLNGSEIGGGSIRSHEADVLHKVFEILGFNDKQIKTNFGHMLEAFQYGTPPHGGIALGLDRLIMLLAEENSIREVIAFPKNAEARDLMMDAPSEVDKKQLEELGLQLKK